RYKTRQEAKMSIFEYIETFYNFKRIHSTIGYLSPIAFKKQYEQLLSHK
ncbi:IS3 family transposase, partial [Gracilibacillus boraciitolerans]